MYCVFGTASLAMFLLSTVLIMGSGICHQVAQAQVGSGLAEGVADNLKNEGANSTLSYYVGPDCDGPGGVFFLMFFLAFKARFMGWLTWIPLWTFLGCELGFFSAWCPERERAEAGEDSLLSDGELRV